MCLDKKVLIAAAAAVAALWLTQPSWTPIAIVLIATAICPLSMLLMLRRSAGATPARDTAGNSDLDRLEAELSALRRELERRSSGAAKR